MFKVICILGLVVIMTCQQLEAAPHANKNLLDMSQTELMHKFEQFMSEDKQAAEIRQHYVREVEHKIRKRQAEVNDMDALDLDGLDGTDVQKGEAGFLDRAAKFVLELVQRFLKWINTD